MPFRGTDPISESAGWHSPQEGVNSRCRETIPACHLAHSVSRACLFALGLLPSVYYASFKNASKQGGIAEVNWAGLPVTG